MKKVFGIKFGRRGNSSGVVPQSQESPGISNAEILPPFGTKNPVTVSSKTSPSDLSKRTVASNPFDGWWLTLPAKLRPQQVLNILRSAQGGDVWQLAQLHDLMLTLWPMYKKCCAELKEAVASVKFDVHPYCEDGEEPTESAKEKADFVRRCLTQMNPHPSNDERDFHGTIYHLADVLLMGVGMQEIIWNEPSKGKEGWEQIPRATAYIHPRHFTYTQDGFLTVFDENYSRYEFNAYANAVNAPDPDRFICAQYYSHMGSPLSAGLIRPLARWFSVYIFNQEWMFNDAQMHGSPFLDLVYAPGTPSEEVKKMIEYAQNAANNRFIAHVAGTTVTMESAVKKGDDNPQIFLANEADKQCQLLILGQTLTTDVADSGSRALGDVHMDVRTGRIESLAKWIAQSPLNQFARAILRVNYGKNGDGECPTITPDFTETLTPAEKASLISSISNSQMPFLADEIYKLLGFGVPEGGDNITLNGKLGVCGDTTEEISPIGLQSDGEIDQQLDMTEQMAKIAKQHGPSKSDSNKPVKSSSELRRILSQASNEDLAELRDLIVKAKEAPYANGELELVKVKINHIKEKRFNYE